VADFIQANGGLNLRQNMQPAKACAGNRLLLAYLAANYAAMEEIFTFARQLSGHEK
jgi:hypothetical protein